MSTVKKIFGTHIKEAVDMISGNQCASGTIDETGMHIDKTWLSTDEIAQYKPPPPPLSIERLRELKDCVAMCCGFGEDCNDLQRLIEQEIERTVQHEH